MAQGDAVFARGNVDWPLDPRCQALSNNDARWLHEVMWRCAVKARQTSLPTKYNPEWFCRVIGITSRKFHKCLREFSQVGLIQLSVDNRLVIIGVQENNPKLHWKKVEGQYYPELMKNPWVAENLDTGYIWDPYPTHIQPIRVPIEKEKEKEKEKESPDPLQNYPTLSEFYPKLHALIQETHPRAKLPKFGTQADRDSRKVLAQLIHLDKFTEQGVVDCFVWLFMSENKQAMWWRKQVQGIAPLRTIRTGKTMHKFAQIEERWREAHDERPTPVFAPTVDLHKLESRAIGWVKEHGGAFTEESECIAIEAVANPEELAAWRKQREYQQRLGEEQAQEDRVSATHVDRGVESVGEILARTGPATQGDAT